ncbi:collagen alpha-1(I) chain-like [Oxyura jamaicensis]|uniref:collagen alpha-1(I) chain-like n=1 Tax=Oxyura jamaicensis TaxID=8884 RepID=UPI0015A5AAC9|nr:collagen alpha-1(I) chain-like [Oxyura jamaicensis]
MTNPHPPQAAPDDLKAQDTGVTTRPPGGDVSLQSWGRLQCPHWGHRLEQGTPRSPRPPRQGLSCCHRALRSRGQHRSHERLRPCPPHGAPPHMGTPGRAEAAKPGSGDMRGAAGSAHTRGAEARKGKGPIAASRGGLKACGEEFRIAASLRPAPPSPSPQAEPAKFGLGTSAGTGGCGGATPGGDAPQGRLALGCTGGVPGTAGLSWSPKAPGAPGLCPTVLQRCPLSLCPLFFPFPCSTPRSIPGTPPARPNHVHRGEETLSDGECSEPSTNPLEMFRPPSGNKTGAGAPSRLLWLGSAAQLGSGNKTGSPGATPGTRGGVCSKRTHQKGGQKGVVPHPHPHGTPPERSKRGCSQPWAPHLLRFQVEKAPAPFQVCGIFVLARVPPPVPPSPTRRLQLILNSE